MKRVPVGATIVVALAVVAMIALGLWQLRRLDEKRALLATYAANATQPPIAMPPVPGDASLFRRVVATCAAPKPTRREAGRAADGASGWRVIADCPAPGGGRGGVFAVQLGVAGAPTGAAAWSGGTVIGYLTHAPQHRALIDPAPAEMMVVAATPLAGLKPSPPANLDDVPNNHLAYAVQWFLFAGIAAIIYAVALRRRVRDGDAPRGRGPVATPPARG